MNKKKSKTKNRCQEGWRLFHMMGDSFDYESKQESPDWERHDEIVKKYDQHNLDCVICQRGRNELQISFEEMKVENGAAIS